MAKSKRKSGSSTDISRWETELAQVNISENDWKVLIVFAVPDEPQVASHIGIMTEVISSGIRKLFSIIDHDLLIKEVRDLGHGKAAKGKIAKPPQFVEIAEVIKSTIDRGEEISPALMAKLLKFKLLMLKQKDLERRDEEKKAAEAAAKQSKQEDRSRSKAGNSSQGKRSKSQSPGRKKGKKDDAPSSPKKDTKLKRRGDVDETIKTIDDEPDGDDDPKHYVIINGVHDAKVFQCLLDLGVTVDAVIKMKVEANANDSARSLPVDGSTTEIEESGEVNTNQEKEEELMKLKENLSKFWRENNVLVKEAASGSKLKNIADLTVSIRNTNVPGGDLSELQQEVKTEYGTKMFDVTAQCCYDLLSAWKQYKRYLGKVRLTHVLSTRESLQPEVSSPSAMKPIAEVTESGEDANKSKDQADLRFYQHLMDKVPCELQSVNLILDSLLQQADATVNNKHPMEDLISPREDLLDDVLGSHLDEKLKNLGIANISKEVASVPPTESPAVIKAGDKQSQKLLNLRDRTDLPVEEIENRMNNLHSLSSLMKLPSFAEEEKISILSRKQQFKHFLGRENKDCNIEKLMSLLSLETIPIRRVGSDGRIADPRGKICGPEEDVDNVEKEGLSLGIGWDDPYYKNSKSGQNTDESVKNEDEKISEKSNAETRLRNLENYCFSESFDNNILVQVLNEAKETRPFIDWYSHRGLDSVLAILHNPKDDRLQNAQTWSTWLHSDVGFRNYLEHVAKSVSDWQREEDVLEEVANRPVLTGTPEREPTPEPLKAENRSNMLKRSEIEEMKAAEEEKNKKKGKKSRSRSSSPNKRPTTDSKKTKTPDKKDRGDSAKKRPPSSRKGGSRMGTAKKSAKLGHDKKLEEEQNQESEVKEESEKEYAFHGYDVGDDLIHLSGRKSYLFPQDGGLVKVERTEFITGHNAVRISLIKDGNLLVMHHINPVDAAVEDLGDKPSTQQQDSDEMEENASELKTLFSNLPALPELPAPQSEESCITFTLDDGLHVAIEPGVNKVVMKKLEELKDKLTQTQATLTAQQPSATAAASGAANTKASSPKGKRKQEDEVKRQEEIEKQNEIELRLKMQQISQDIVKLRKSNLGRRNMAVSVPDGLHIRFLHREVPDATMKRVLYVRQERPLLDNGLQSPEQLNLNSSLKEKCRYITTDGTVIKFMMDGSVIVLFADGSVCSSPATVTPATPKPNASIESAQAATPAVNPNASEDNVDSSQERSGPEWFLINSRGERYHKTLNSEEVKSNDIHLSYAVCPTSSQVLETREDGTIIVKRPNGTRIVEHSDGTRITTFLREMPRKTEHETGEEEVAVEAEIESIKVEGIGFATVLINKKTSEMQTIFGNETCISARLNGGYRISKPDSTKLLVSEKGDIIFAPRNVLSRNLPTDNLFKFIDGNNFPTGIYSFRCSSPDCFSTVDCHGNKFTVSPFGVATVNTAENGKSDKGDEVLQPRYFVIHRDGQGEELFHENDVSSFLEEAEKDPLVAVIKSESVDQTGMMGITVLKPMKGGFGDQWLKEKDEKDIIPCGLRERNFKTFPSTEVIHSGPKFGSNAGIAFQVGSKPSKMKSSLPAACPSTLHLRHLVKFRGLDADERQKMEATLDSYQQFMKTQHEVEQGWQPQDPRGKEEKSLADALSAELTSKLQKMEPTNKSLQESLVKPKEDYMKATAPPSPPPVRKAVPERSQREWEKDKIQIAELNSAKDYLKSGFIPPYFDTEEGQAFLYSSDSNMRIEEIASKLAKESIHPSMRPVSVDSSNIDEHRPRSSVLEKENDFSHQLIGAIQESSSAVNVTMNAARPGNPTPAVAMKDAQPSLAHVGSNAQDRPYNPTPMTSAVKAKQLDMGTNGQVPSYTSTHYADEYSMDYHSDESPRNNNTQFNVKSTAEVKKAPLPRSIQGSRPGALPNDRFARIEEGVRRQVKTASVAGSVNPKLTANMRGFKIVPDFVDFGVLKEGLAYTYPVFIENVGVDSCRFKVTQPPPSTGLKVRFKAGPVAAGMSARLDIEIFAVAVGLEGTTGAGSVGHHIEIITETDAMYLPVAATVLTAQEYESGRNTADLEGPSPSVMLLTDRPTSREELTRPRRD